MPSSVIIALVAGSTLNSSAANLSTAVNGVASGTLRNHHIARDARNLRFNRQEPLHVDIIGGVWWNIYDAYVEPSICVDKRSPHILAIISLQVRSSTHVNVHTVCQEHTSPPPRSAVSTEDTPAPRTQLRSENRCVQIGLSHSHYCVISQ